jgi:hypothetical protein
MDILDFITRDQLLNLGIKWGSYAPHKLAYGKCTRGQFEADWIKEMWLTMNAPKRFSVSGGPTDVSQGGLRRRV